MGARTRREEGRVLGKDRDLKGEGTLVCVTQGRKEKRLQKEKRKKRPLEATEGENVLNIRKVVPF